MKLTPEERWARIDEMARGDDHYTRMMADFDPARKWFEAFTERLPRRLSNRLWTYPGMGYLMHNRILALVCEHMKFQDED